MNHIRYLAIVVTATFCSSTTNHRFLASGFHPSSTTVAGSPLRRKNEDTEWMREITLLRTTSNDSNNDDDDDGNGVNEQQPIFTLKQRNPYDVHVYYDGEDERQEAMDLQRKMQENFDWMRFYNPKDRPIGPHPVPMWEADFGNYDNRHMWIDVRDFIEKEHGTLSVLIHPHSLDGDYADHTKNAFWAGEILDLRIQGWKK
jgi:DOPA 4,5-dioxygenase